MQRSVTKVDDIEKLILSYLLETEADLDQFVNLYPLMFTSATKIKDLISSYRQKYTLPNYEQVSKEIQVFRTFAVEDLGFVNTSQSNLLDSIFELLEIAHKPLVVKNQMVLLIALLEKTKNPSIVLSIENIELSKTVKRCEDFLKAYPANKRFGHVEPKRFDDILIMFFQLKIHELLPKFISYQCCHIFGDNEVEVIEEEKMLYKDTKSLIEKRSSQIEQSRKTNFKMTLVSFCVSLVAVLSLFTIPRNDDGSVTKNDENTKLFLYSFFTMVISASLGSYFITENRDIKRKLTFFQEKTSYLLPKDDSTLDNKISSRKLQMH
ncbi:MAG: hypothetical protein V4501_11915 [Pseudomonadota bacterium]